MLERRFRAWGRLGRPDADGCDPVDARDAGSAGAGSGDVESSRAMQRCKDVVKKGAFTTGPERDYTVKIDVDGLEAGQVYYYWFTAGQTSSPAGVTRTLPASGVADYRMAVVSCSNWPFGYFNVYREIAKRGQASVIDAVIHLGDYIYEYGVNGYGGAVGKEIGRNHEPEHESCRWPTIARACAVQVRTRTCRRRMRSRPGSARGTIMRQPTIPIARAQRTISLTRKANGRVRKAGACRRIWNGCRFAIRQPARRARRSGTRFDIGDLATLFLLESRLVGRGR
jgi:alkaline phosphatase D